MLQLQLQLRLSQAQCTQPKHNPCVSCSSPVLPIAPTIQDPDQPIPSVVRPHTPISTQRALHGRHFGVFFSPLHCNFKLQNSHPFPSIYISFGGFVSVFLFVCLFFRGVISFTRSLYVHHACLVLSQFICHSS